MKFRPLHDRVLIKVLDSEEKTAGGIIIPDTAKEKPQEGEVVAVGPGAKSDEGKKFTLQYEVEEPERYFENAFLIDCQKFNMSFKYPKGKDIKRPKLLEVHQETEESIPSTVEPIITEEGEIETVKWEIVDIPKGRTFRIDW